MVVSNLVNDILISSVLYAKNNRDEFITAEHILYCALSFDEVITAINNCNGDLENLKTSLKGYIDNISKIDEGDEPEESYSFSNVLLGASKRASVSESNEIKIEHIIASIYELDESYAKFYLLDSNLNKEDFIFNLCHRQESKEAINDNKLDEVEGNKVMDNKPSLLEKYTENITMLQKEGKLDPIIGRENELNRTIQILLRRNKNNPIHIGEPGVGKTSLVYGLSQLIEEGNVPKKLQGSTIYSLDIGSVLAGTKYRGDFEERIKSILNQLKKIDKPILYIDEIHNLVGAGSLNSSSLDASNLLKPYLTEGHIKFIGSTTFEEYKKYFEKDKGLVRRFQSVEINEPSKDETLLILKKLKNKYEEFHQVKYLDESLSSAVNLTAKFINDRFFPDKAIDIIDEAGSLSNINNKSEVTEEDIEEVVSKYCSIPKKNIQQDEKEKLRNLDIELSKKIFGQDDAIKEVSRCIKMSKAGLNDDNKPIASLLFVGPTGVGKTEIAKTLSNLLDSKLIRFDMSEYAEKHAASKLIGTAPGYVGYEEGGLLTDAIRKSPNSILLLDEIEKAHIDILNVLLQVMDYATLTDNKGKKVDFRNVIIIMTSNVGAKNIGKPIVGFGNREVDSSFLLEEVRKYFTPEFRNRLDKIIRFNNIDDVMAKEITIKELNQFKNKLLSKGIIISFTDECINHISKIGISKEYGAREIIRIINEKVKPLLVDKILNNEFSEGYVDVKKEEFILTINK